MNPSLGGGDAAVAETHISWVFFVGDRVYKLKKPVRTAFLDFTTPHARRLDCEREVALNRRLAPDVYQGVATLSGPDGRPCDYLVVMRRMPDDRRLAALISGGGPEPELRRALLAIAGGIAGFHAKAERSPEIEAAGTTGTTAARWRANTEQLRPFAGGVLDGVMIEEVDTLADRYLAGRARLFDARIAGGHVIDGHGDLLADDIFCLDDGPRILDCLEFDDGLRWGDGLADAAFLAMDLERLGRRDLAAVFLAAYRAASGDDWPASLADHYVAYRAQVRSKVACLRAAQGGGTVDQARQLLTMAKHHLERAAVRVVLVGGLPGTGKSTLAAGLGRLLGWPVLRSDIVRKELAGVAPVARGGPVPYRQGMYRAEATDATYRALLARASTSAAMGQSVILDASWSSAPQRTAAREMASGVVADLLELRCVAPLAVAADRIERRLRATDDPSDATPTIASAMADDADPWPDAIVVDTTTSVDEVVAAAAAAVAPEAGAR